MELSLVGGWVLLADGVIDAVGGAPRGSRIDVGGRLILPGLVDLHGDAFERQIMPRPGVQFGLDVALHDTDRQLLANAITTAFHGVTYSWEPGLRGRESFGALLAAIERLRPTLLCDTRVHLRFETYNLEAVDPVCDRLASGEIDLLAFNDHMDDTLEDLRDATARYAGRTGLAEVALRDLVETVAARGEIAAGRRADLVIVDDSVPDFPRVIGAPVAGRLVYGVDPSLVTQPA